MEILNKSMRIINLLPKSEQDELKTQQIYVVLRKLLVFSGIVYVLVAAILIGYRFYMQSTLNDLGNQIDKQKAIISKQDNSAIRQEVNDDTAAVANYNHLVDVNPNWSGVLEELAKLLPPGVSITHLNVNTGSGKILISGGALNRDSILQLRLNILASKYFQNIDLPLDNLQKPANTTYHYSFSLTKDALKAGFAGSAASVGGTPSSVPTGTTSSTPSQSPAAQGQTPASSPQGVSK